jgi:hypothetical protein
MCKLVVEEIIVIFLLLLNLMMMMTTLGFFKFFFFLGRGGAGVGFCFGYGIVKAALDIIGWKLGNKNCFLV